MAEKNVIRKLAECALEARENAYVPYSGFAVGAALLTADGIIYTGCNVENASYSATSCAERTAIFKAVSEGKTQFEMIAIAGGKQNQAVPDFCPPCGICRQVLSEFGKPDMKVLLVKSPDEIQEWTLKDLLPAAFQKENL